MGRGRSSFGIPALGRALMTLVMALFMLANPASARAAPAPAGFTGSACHISLAKNESYADVAASPSRWRCEGREFDWKAPRHIVRIDLTALANRTFGSRYLEFERHEFARLHIQLFGADGSSVQRAYRFGDLRLGDSSLRSIADLPELSAEPTLLVMTVEGGDWPEVLLDAQLTDTPSVRAIAGFEHLLAALLCGLLLAPLLFDLGYYRALREPFPLYHAVFCLMAFIQTAAVSGLIPLLAPLPLDIELDITYFSLDVMFAATFFFAANFVERDCLDQRHRRFLMAAALFTIANGQATSYWVVELGGWVDHIYFGGYLLALGSYFVILRQAWTRGSHTAPYLLAGFTPITAIILLQWLQVVAPVQALKFDETWPQNIALLFEVIATALAVADRFMAIRRERDKALDEARTLGFLSERDELTGLLNRRALEARYTSLVLEGFHSMAVVDIDYFKSINDLYGHPVGDAVLRCTADALNPMTDPDLLAFRIGGEEFLLLLRGADGEKRAEARRRAVTARVLAEMEGFDRPVTASMGFLDFSEVACEPGIDFGAIYTRVDQLLYEAKCDGRNRMCADRLKLFVPGGDDAAFAEASAA